MKSQFAVLPTISCFDLGFFITLFPNFHIVLFHNPCKFHISFQALKLRRNEGLYNILVKSSYFFGSGSPGVSLEVYMLVHLVGKPGKILCF